MRNLFVTYDITFCHGDYKRVKSCIVLMEEHFPDQKQSLLFFKLTLYQFIKFYPFKVVDVD